MAVTYDVALSSSSNYFAARVGELCSQLDLSYFLVQPVWVEEFLKKLQARDIEVEVLIDMAADLYLPDDPYLKLAREVKKQGGCVIDDPDTGATMAHKGRFHQILVNNYVPVPETVVVPRSEVGSFRLTDDLRIMLGVPFVVKPGWGGGGQGVNVAGRSEKDLIDAAGKCPNSDSFLLQRKVTPKKLDSHVGWFRVFHVLGEVIPCWWEPPANQYQLVSPLQRRLYKLAPVSKIVREIARVSKMKFFSSEVCLTSEGKFVAVDYLNTDPDMSPKSFYPTGVPDEVIRHIAWLLVDEALNRVKRRQGYFDDELEERDLDWDYRRRRGLLVPGE
jgi:hypothetical protein